MELQYKVSGERLKQVRIEANMTQGEVAEKCGLQQYNTVANWEKENATPSLKMLLRLCEIFECELGYFLCEEGYEAKTRSRTDIKKKTGLSEKAIKQLEILNILDEDVLHLIDLLLVNSYFITALQGLSKSIAISRDVKQCDKDLTELNEKLKEMSMGYEDRHEYIQIAHSEINRTISKKNNIEKIELSPYDASRFYYLAADSDLRSAIADVKRKIENCSTTQEE